MAKGNRSLRFASLAEMPPAMRAKALVALEKGRLGSAVPIQAAEAHPEAAIVIDLPLRTPLTNQWMRMHFRSRMRYCRAIAVQIAIHASRRPAEPLQRCRVVVERFSTQEPDRDGLFGSLKAVLDALQPQSRTHPYGLGFIADDSSSCITELLPKHVPGREKRTRITIESLGASRG